MELAPSLVSRKSFSSITSTSTTSSITTIAPDSLDNFSSNIDVSNEISSENTSLTTNSLEKNQKLQSDSFLLSAYTTNTQDTVQTTQKDSKIDAPRLKSRNIPVSSIQESGSIPSRTQYAVVIILSPHNGTFDRKSLILPFYPDVLKLGRQTSVKTVPASDNGYFDSRVLSRQHAEIWADRITRKVYIKDAKSSNGTYINGKRLSADGQESEPHELHRNDILELGIDIANDDSSALLHRKISAFVERISIMSLQSQDNSKSLLGKNSNSRSRLTSSRKSESLDVALFGDFDTTLEDLALVHSRNSVGGLFLKSGITSSTNLETTVKTLAEQVHSTRVETAKLESVRKMLSHIHASQKKAKTLQLEIQNNLSKEFKSNIEILQSEVSSLKNELMQKNARIAELESIIASTPSSKSIEDLKSEIQISQNEVKNLNERADLAEQQAYVYALRLSEYKLQNEEDQKLLQQNKQNQYLHIPIFQLIQFSFGVFFLAAGIIVVKRFI